MGVYVRVLGGGRHGRQQVFALLLLPKNAVHLFLKSLCTVIESLHAATQGLWSMACPEIEHILSILEMLCIPGENLWPSLTEQCFRKQVEHVNIFLELRISESQEKGVKEDKKRTKKPVDNLACCANKKKTEEVQFPEKKVHASATKIFTDHSDAENNAWATFFREKTSDAPNELPEITKTIFEFRPQKKKRPPLIFRKRLWQATSAHGMRGIAGIRDVQNIFLRNIFRILVHGGFSPCPGPKDITTK